MIEPIEATSLIDWKKSDKRILMVFWVAFSSIFAVTLVALIYLFRASQPGSKPGIFDIIGAFFFVLVISFLFSGSLAYKYHRKRGIIPTKRVLKWFAIISSVSAIVFTILVLVLISADVRDNLELLVGTVFIYLGLILAVFLVLIVFMIVGFGVFGVMSVIQRRYTAEYLVKVSHITPNAGDTTGKKGGIIYPVLQWLFNIPDVLDSNTLTVDEIHPRKRFPWRTLGSALMWEIFFSAVLAIYISLNPFLFEIGTFQQRFSLSSSLSIIIPMFIIPWFIYLRLNARIKGPVKDFKLFDGIKSRMVGTLVAFGTLIVFLRFALRDISAFKILEEFTNFYFFFIVVTIIFTFVYLNYFEDDLAMTVHKEFDELKD